MRSQSNRGNRRKKFRSVCLIALVLLVFLATTAMGDQIILYDGKVVDGKVISESDTLVTIEVDTIRISLLRKDVKEIKYGDQLFESLERDSEPEKPITDKSVLPALRETAQAERSEQEQQAPEETPTEAPEPPTAVSATPTATEKPASEPTEVVEEPAEQEPIQLPTVPEVAETEQEEEYPVPEIDPSELPRGRAYIITYDYANIRKGPSTADEQLARLDKGDILIVDEIADNGWVHFDTLEGEVTGWVHGNLVEKLPDTPVVVSDEFVNFRKGPGTAQVKLGTLEYTQVGRLLEEKPPWMKIRLPDGRTGWAHGDYLTKVPMTE